MSRVCVDCIKEPHLKQLVKSEGEKGLCTSCGNEGESIATDYNRFFQLLKALIRFNYSEWEYNTHWGGDSYHSLFYGSDNIFFHESRATSEDSYEDMVLPIIESPVYEDYDKGITVFAGYDEDGSPAGILRSIKSERSVLLHEISERLKTENYFIVEEQLKGLLEKYKGKMECSLRSGVEFYRARIGFKEKKNAISKGFDAEEHYTPYKNNDIGSPPPRISGEGRINRSGVSFFYGATDVYTAISEVRPHPGDKVSIGKFILNKDIVVCDFSDSQIMHFFENDQLLDEMVHLNTLNVYMNKTVAPSGKEHYTTTQLIADCLRQMGYDGILFNSTVGAGVNLTIFRPEHMQYLEKESHIVEVESVQYEYGILPLINDGEIYR